MNGWQAIVTALKAEKVRYIFGSPGGEAFYDTLYKIKEITPILVREESSGPFMAMALRALLANRESVLARVALEWLIFSPE